MIKLLLAACACVQSFVLRPPQLRRTAALRAVDDERPPESDAEAQRIAEMRARMEAMFGGGEAPAAAADGKKKEEEKKAKKEE